MATDQELKDRLYAQAYKLRELYNDTYSCPDDPEERGFAMGERYSDTLRGRREKELQAKVAELEAKLAKLKGPKWWRRK